MKDNFEGGVSYIVTNYEGGYSDNPRDPGGATYQGVTQRVYDAYRQQQKKPLQSVRFMAIAERTEIYRTQYWDEVRGDDCPSGVDFVLFDAAINSGPVKSTELLQKALGLVVDGHWGLATTQALSGVNDFGGLIERLCSLRLTFMHNLGTWRYFSVSWQRRVEDVKRVALSVYNVGNMSMVKAPSGPVMGPKKDIWQGIWTIVVGLVVAILPSALQYLAGVDWTQYLSPSGALFVSGAIMAIFRMVQNTDTKIATKL